MPLAGWVSWSGAEPTLELENCLSCQDLGAFLQRFELFAVQAEQ